MCLDDKALMDRSWWRRYLVVSAAVTAGFFLLPTGGRGQAVVQVALNAGALAAIVGGVLAHRPEGRAAWWTLAVGEALYVAAGVVFFAYPPFAHAVLPFPSVADALYLGAYAVLAVGVALLARRGAGRDPGGLIDVAIVTVGAGLVSFVFVIAPNATSSSVSELERAVAVAYPVLDVLLLAVAARLAVGGLGTPAQRLLGLWLASQLAADAWYAATVLHGTFHLGHPVTAGWLLSFGFLGAAALHPSMRTLATPRAGRERGGRRARLAVLAGASLLAPGLLVATAVRHGESDTSVIAIGVASALIFLLVIARIRRLMVDVRVLEAAEARLRASEAGLEEAQRLAQLGSWTWDLATGEVTWSDELFRIFGQPPDEAGASFEAFEDQLHPCDREWVLELVRAAAAGDAQLDYECRIVRPDGAVRVIYVHGELTTDTAGRAVRMVGTVQDVTERNHAQQSIQRLAAIVASSSDAILSIAPDRTVTSWNTGAERLLGWSAAEIVGRPLTTLWPPERLASDEPMLERALGGEVVADFETVRLRRDGTRVAVALTWSPIKDDAGRVAGVSMIARDVTERKRLEEQLVRQALHDPLTGLANRVLFRDRLAHALDRVAREGERLAVLILDLDDFKLVNDALGHATGDRLLAEVAERLRRGVRASDTVARLGGDEFAVLLEAVQPGEPTATAERLLATLDDPVELDGTRVRAPASVGIVESTGQAEAGVLLRNADVAMYAAKATGKSTWALFDTSMQAAVADRLELDAELRHAVEGGQFELHYQPIVALPDGELVGYEALLRWRHPERGLIGPDRFIPLLEASGLIIPVGWWVLREACAQVAAWRARTGRPLTISVNVSPRQLYEADIADQVTAALAATGLPPDALVVEITEGVMIADTEGTIAKLHAVKALGVRVAVDDFGSGYSSLRYLHIFPVDILKIDQSFVATMHDGPEQSALARAIVMIGHALRLVVVAEGIETAEQLEQLRELGCQYGQGYHFARPEPPAAVEARLATLAQPLEAMRGG